MYGGRDEIEWCVREYERGTMEMLGMERRCKVTARPRTPEAPVCGVRFECQVGKVELPTVEGIGGGRHLPVTTTFMMVSWLWNVDNFGK